MNKTRLQGAFWIFICCLLVASGGGWLWLSSQPYPFVKPFLDSFFDQKGFETLNPINFPVFIWIFRFLGLALWILAPVVLFWRRRVWPEFQQFIKNLFLDFVAFLNSLKPRKAQRGMLLLVALIVLLAIFLRLKEINTPMLYDEAYTYVYFASGTFQRTISDYHVVNNHVFNSVLVYFSTHIFGNAPWAVRMPVFILGIFLIIVVYWLAAKLYDRRVAIVSAALAACTPLLISYSTNARGYIILALIWLLTLLLGNYLFNYKNRFAWGGLSFLSAVGFYTLPVMLFPYGALVLWLFMSNLIRPSPEPYRSKNEFFIYLSVSILSTAFLSLLLYMPIFIHSGFRQVFENGVVSSSPWKDFWPIMLLRLQETWNDWIKGVPLVVVWLLTAGNLVNLIFDLRTGRKKFPLQWATLINIAVILIVWHPDTPVRIWVFLLPMVVIWGAAGIISLVDRVSQFLMQGRHLSTLVAGLSVIFLIASCITALSTFSDHWSSKGEMELTAQYLKKNLQVQDFIVVSTPIDAQIWYYTMLEGISFDHYMKELSQNRILVLAAIDYDQTMDEVIQSRGLIKNELDCNANSPLETIVSVKIYECRYRK